MIKPRYIKSLTFLLLCNMALGQETLSASFSWFGIWSFVNLAESLKMETAKIRATCPVFFLKFSLQRFQLVTETALQSI